MFWLQAANNLFALDRSFSASRELARTWADRVATAEADREVAQELVQAAEDRERALQNEITRLKADRVRLARDLEAEKTCREESQQKLAGIQVELESTRMSLMSSEAAAGTAQAELYINRLETQSAREKAHEAVKEMEAAKRAATESVEVFKASAEYKAAMIAAGQLFFITGFGKCKKEVGEAFPGLDLSAIEEPVFNQPEPDSESGSEEEEDEEESEQELSVEQASLPTEKALEEPTVEAVGAEPALEVLVETLEVPTGTQPAEDLVAAARTTEESAEEPTAEEPTA